MKTTPSSWSFPPLPELHFIENKGNFYRLKSVSLYSLVPAGFESRRSTMRALFAVFGMGLLATPALPQSTYPITVQLRTSDGQDAGTAIFQQNGQSKLSIKFDLKNLPAGSHGVHIHQNPTCDAPGFTTAGGHFNPESKQHGTMNPMGSHAGDLPQNIVVSGKHTAQVTMKVDHLSLDPTSPDSVIGHSIMVHADADDMKTDPAGNAGSRIACGVITAAK
jgi:Cu-Zn family superoxide dismutase